MSKLHDFECTSRFSGSYGQERMGSVEPVLWTFTCKTCGAEVTFNGCIDGDAMRLHDNDYEAFMRLLNEGNVKNKKIEECKRSML